jgi:hypothetical protein
MKLKTLKFEVHRFTGAFQILLTFVNTKYLVKAERISVFVMGDFNLIEIKPAGGRCGGFVGSWFR